MGSASAKVKLTILANEILNKAIQAGVVPSTILEDLDLRNGTSCGQIDVVFARSEDTIAASTTTTYTLDTGENDSFGEPIAFVEVVLVLLRNTRCAVGAYLELGANGINGFGALNANKGFWKTQPDRTIVAPGGWACMYEPTGVDVDGTHSDLDVATSAVVGDINSWDILILGRSA